MDEIITWIPTKQQLPDDEITVMLFVPEHDEPVWLGYHEDYAWYLTDGTPLAQNAVTHWANFPNGPELELPKCRN